MNKKSFTLIELLVVIAIIGILSSLVIGRFNNLQERARITNTLQWSSGLHKILGASLLGHWDFNDGPESITVKDISGYGYDGTFSGDPGPVWIDGVDDYALSFDGVHSTDTARIDTGLCRHDHNPEYTISLWIFPREKRTFQFLVGGNRGNNISMGLLYQDYERVSFSTYDCNGVGHGLLSPSGTVKLNKWTHITASVNYSSMEEGIVSGNVVIYIDGIKKASGELNNVKLCNSCVIMGSPLSNDHLNNRAFNGLIDDVSFYSKSFSEAEAYYLYSQQKDKYLVYE